MKKVKNNISRNIAIGAGVATLAAAGYLFFGPDGKKHSQATHEWMIKMKAEILEKMETIKDVTKDAYYNVVDKIAETYTKVTNKRDVKRFARELKSHWEYFLDENTPKAKKII